MCINNQEHPEGVDKMPKSFAGFIYDKTLDVKRQEKINDFRVLADRNVSIFVI